MRNTYKFTFVFLSILFVGVFNLSSVISAEAQIEVSLINENNIVLPGYFVALYQEGYSLPLGITNANGISVDSIKLYAGTTFDVKVYSSQNDYSQNAVPKFISGPHTIDDSWTSEPKYRFIVTAAGLEPIDPNVCSPVCVAGQTCQNGQCVTNYPLDASGGEGVSEFSYVGDTTSNCPTGLINIGEVFYDGNNDPFHFCYSHETFAAGHGYVEDINFAEGGDCGSLGSAVGVGFKDKDKEQMSICVKSVSGATAESKIVSEIEIRKNEVCSSDFVLRSVQFSSDFVLRSVQLNDTTTLNLCLKFVNGPSSDVCTEPTRACNAENLCVGTETCANGVWGACVKADSNCGMPGCTAGTSENCSVGSCEGTKFCDTNGVWGACMKDASSSCNAQINPDLTAIYRKYLTGFEDGFLTTNPQEECGLQPLFCAFKTSDSSANLVILYRLFNKKSDSTADHLYTTSRDEALTLNATGWDWEGGEVGIAKLSSAQGDGMIPVYRYYRGDQNFDHDFGLNSNAPEGYVSQGVIGYAYSNQSCEAVVPKSCEGGEGSIANPIAGGVGGCAAGIVLTWPLGPFGMAGGCVAGAVVGTWAGQNIQGIGDAVNNVGKFIGDITNNATNSIKGVGDGIGGLGGNIFNGFGKVFDGLKQILWPFG